MEIRAEGNILRKDFMIFVYIDKVSAHFIPKHFFANEMEANNFKMAIIDKCKHLHDVA